MLRPTTLLQLSQIVEMYRAGTPICGARAGRQRRCGAGRAASGCRRWRAATSSTKNLRVARGQRFPRYVHHFCENSSAVCRLRRGGSSGMIHRSGIGFGICTRG
jgi:hypothetical protein